MRLTFYTKHNSLKFLHFFLCIISCSYWVVFYSVNVTVCLNIHSWCIFGLFQFFAIWIELPKTFMYRLLCEWKFSLFWDNCPRVWLLDHMVSVGNFQLIFQGGCVILLSHQCVWKIKFLCILASIYYCYYFFYLANSWILISHHDLNLQYLMGNDSGYLFMCLFVTHILSLLKCLFI